MRLICPNCDAEYEVDDAAIPETGRDVQCSNCGHAWFEKAADAVLTASPHDMTEQPALPPEPTQTPIVAVAEPSVATPEVAADGLGGTDEMPIDAAPVAPRMDDAILAILKEEAEREVAARRAEAMPVEVQPDLGLETGAAAVRARQIARRDDVAPEAAEALAVPEQRDALRQLTRRELLPNIEEINSTLRPSSAVQHDDADDRPQLPPVAAASGGFRNGFVLMLVVAGVLAVLYLMAPRLAVQIPAAQGALEAYVAGVDQARSGLDTATRSLIAGLQRLAGGE